MIYTICGARPNFIKIDPELPQEIIHTGQHYDYEMSKSFFDDLKLPKPKYNLGCKDKVGKMIDKMIDIFRKDRPEMVLVFGDTNSSLAGALAAAYENIPIAHVESGLRSFNMAMPEEINRVTIDHLSKVKLCPNSYSIKNLAKEGIRDDVYLIGDPSFDAMAKFMPIKKIKNCEKYILITIHRNFNTDSPEFIKSFFEAIKETKEKYIFPIHPRTRKVINENKISIPNNIDAIDPVSYGKMLSLISNSKKVITDSGGVQREAYWMVKPVIILRSETEWEEIVNKNCGVLIGQDMNKLVEAINSFKGGFPEIPEFGANKRIKNILFKYL